MIRTIVIACLCIAPATASPADWSIYGGVSYGRSAGQIHANTSSYTATPHASGYIQPGSLEQYAIRSGAFTAQGPELFIGGRYGVFLADISGGLATDEPHEPRWELMAGLQPPAGWPIRFDSQYLKVIPSFVVGGGAGEMGMPGGYMGYTLRRGPYASAALRADIRAWKFLLRIAGQYRGMFTKHQRYLDLTDGPSIDYDFAKAGFSWDLGFSVGLGLEFP